MPEEQNIPISSFPDASSIDGADTVTGLQNNVNTNFKFSTILAWLVNAFRSAFVPAVRTVNNKSLASDITLSASDVGAQPTITASGILKGNGQGGVSAATAGTDYQAPLTIDATPTAGSTNPVQSGGVYTDVRTRVPVYGMGKNLLDNAYFVGGGGADTFPVNQRGASSYTQGAGTLKVFDRWNLIRGTAVLASGGVNLSWGGSETGGTVGTLRQVIPGTPFTGYTGTFSILYGTGKLMSFTTDMTEDMNQYSSAADDLQLHVFTNSGNTLFDINCGSTTAVTIRAAKFELGSEQTLCHNEGTEAAPVWVLNEIPVYSEEIMKCQRYLYLLPRYRSVRTTALRGNAIYFSVPVPVPLAKEPTLLNDGNLSVQGLTGTGQTGFTFSVSQYAGSYVQITATKNSHGLSDAVLSFGTTAPGAFLSAEP